MWVILWAFLGCDSPSLSKGISKVELDFIESTKGVASNGQKKKTPWKQIFRSKAFWAILAVHSAQNWGFWTLLTEIPSYMKNVLKFDIKSVRNPFLFECVCFFKFNYKFFLECSFVRYALFGDVFAGLNI